MHEIDLDRPAPGAIEVVTQSYIAPQEEVPAPAINLFGTTDPSEVIERAATIATALTKVIDKKGLFLAIRNRRHVMVEGWTLLGSMLGVFPVCLWSKPVEGGWEARVEARTLAGKVVGAAEAQCLRTEKNWRDRDDFALRSMAQTRATSKALRLPLGFVVTLAGYEATPAEEMSVEAEIIAPGPPQAHPGASSQDSPLFPGSVEGAASGSRSPAPARAPQKTTGGPLNPPPEGSQPAAGVNGPRASAPVSPVSPETQAHLDEARARRADAASKITSTPEGRQRLRDAGFQCREPEEDRTEKCKKCGGDMGPSRDGSTIQCIDGKKEWFDLQRAGKTAAEATAMTKGHSFRKVKK